MIKKIFMESVHNNNLILNNKMEILSRISQDNKDNFPQANMNLGENVLQLVNPEKRQAIIVDANRIVINFDDPENIDKAIEMFEHITSRIGNGLQIKRFQRIGVRTFSEECFNTIADANQAIKNSFIKQNGTMLQQFGEELRDFHFGFSSQKNEYKINHNLAAATNQEVNISPEGIKTNMNYVVVCDIDVYIDQEIEIDSIKKFIKDSNEITTSYINEYKKIIRG